jgi:hypothetical protein
MVKKPIAAVAASSKKRDSIALFSLEEYSKVFSQIYTRYTESATTRLKVIDSFLVFLVALGVLQFVFCVLVGTFVSTKLSLSWFIGAILVLLTSLLMGSSEGLPQQLANLYSQRL